MSSMGSGIGVLARSMGPVRGPELFPSVSLEVSRAAPASKAILTMCGLSGAFLIESWILNPSK